MILTPTPEMIAMAESCLAKAGIHFTENGYTGAKRAVLIAIMGTKKQCLQLIADLPTGATEDVMQGHEDCYRAIEVTFTEPPRIVSNPSAVKDGAGLAVLRMMEKREFEVKGKLTRLQEVLSEIEAKCVKCENLNLVGKTCEAKIAGTLRNILRIARGGL